MAKTASISLRIEPAVKAQLEALYARFGISVTDAINIFLHTSLMEGGFPFQPKQPRYNSETEAIIQETKDILAGKVKAKSYANVKEMIEDLIELHIEPDWLLIYAIKDDILVLSLTRTGSHSDLF